MTSAEGVSKTSKRLKINGGSVSESNRPKPGKTRLTPVLKNTEGILIGPENFLIYLIPQPLTNELF